MSKEIIKKIISNNIEVVQSVFDQVDNILNISKKIISTFKNGGKVVIFGNGGSAGDAQHIAAELSGKFYYAERKGLPAISLNTNTSSITAIGNDFGFEYIFSRQLEGLIGKKDLVIGISTSGNSENVINGINFAKEQGSFTVSLSGSKGKLRDICDDCISINSNSTPRIQECHILVGHIICEIVDKHMFDNQ
tara:strand:+ start:36 stop:611 length:576 start_codon:yes stop_codon:yes gene_type:complete